MAGFAGTAREACVDRMLAQRTHAGQVWRAYHLSVAPLALRSGGGVGPLATCTAAAATLSVASTGVGLSPRPCPGHRSANASQRQVPPPVPMPLPRDASQCRRQCGRSNLGVPMLFSVPRGVCRWGSTQPRAAAEQQLPECSEKQT
jgi:hypothetical protein